MLKNDFRKYDILTRMAYIEVFDFTDDPEYMLQTLLEDGIIEIEEIMAVDKIVAAFARDQQDLVQTIKNNQTPRSTQICSEVRSTT